VAGLTALRGDSAEANFAVQFRRRELISRRHKRVRHFYASRYSNLEFPQLVATNASAFVPRLLRLALRRLRSGQPARIPARARTRSKTTRSRRGMERGTNGRRKHDLTAIHNAFYTVPYRESSPRTWPVISMPRRRVISCNKAEEAENGVKMRVSCSSVRSISRGTREPVCSSQSECCILSRTSRYIAFRCGSR